MASPSSTLRPLGKNGPLVPRIGFGAMGLGTSRTAVPLPDDQRLAVLDYAHEVGCTFWDTSDIYVSLRLCIAQTERTSVLTRLLGKGRLRGNHRKVVCSSGSLVKTTN